MERPDYIRYVTDDAHYVAWARGHAPGMEPLPCWQYQVRETPLTDPEGNVITAYVIVARYVVLDSPPSDGLPK